MAGNPHIKEGVTDAELESVILLALFAATQAQQGALIGAYKGKMGIIFKDWYRYGIKLEKALIKDVVNEERLERVSGIITDAVHVLRNEAIIIEKKKKNEEG